MTVDADTHLLLGFVLVLTAMTYVVIVPLRFVLRLGPHGGVDFFVTWAFAALLSFFWLAQASAGGLQGAHLSPFGFLALPLCLIGLLFVGVGLFESPRSSGERRDRVIVGIALTATGFVVFFLALEPNLLTDIASSVSNAPSP